MKDKKCGDCGVLLPIGSFYKRNNYNHTDKIYYFSCCKNCLKKRVYSWKEKNIERWTAYHVEYRRKKKASLKNGAK